MIPDKIRDSIIHALSTQFGPLHFSSFQAVGGGCISHAGILKTDTGNFFVKWNHESFPGMFEAEYQGLKALADTNTLRIPAPIMAQQEQDFSFLVMEHIETANRSRVYWERLGEKLAAMHRITHSSFGWNSSNYIGSLVQENDPATDWINFFYEKRIGFQLKLAIDSGKITPALSQNFERLYVRLPELFPEEPPAMLHGDLWSGNILADELGLPVLIDPAVYFGHREMDISFTRMFGGFDRAFYEAYNAHYPQEHGFNERVDIYNLYPLLVHVNLFGGGYINEVERITSAY